jgi:steroid delta-isomerase
MTSAINDYFAALNSINRAAYLACFAPNATVQDPYGGRTFEGHDGLGRWFNGLERTWESFTMTPGDSFAVADRVAVAWTAEARSHQGKKARFAGINLFTLGEDGLITRLEGYWDAAAMIAQLA